MANANGWGDGASNNNIGWGKGADNAIGWGAIHANSWAGLTDIVGTPAVDPDAQAFITAAAITDPTQQSAINQLVVDLKGYNIWTKMKVLYPFVGGNATSHSYNLRNTSQFQITWNGGVTHSENGVQYNGSNSYGNTNFNCNNTTILNNCAGAYSRTNNTTGAASYGGANASNQGLQLFSRLYNDTLYAANDFILTGSNSNMVTDTRGFFIVNRESNTVKRIYRNGISLSSSDPSGNSGTFNGNLFLGARNSNGSTNQYDNKQYIFNFVADTLTATEITNLTTAVQAFQTTLNRQIP